MNDSSSRRFPGRAIASPVLLAAIILVACGWVLISRLTTTPCAIIIDGHRVVNVESVSVAKQVLSEVRREVAGSAPDNSLRFDQDVTLREIGKDADIADLPEAERKVEKLVTVEAELYAINVDGTPVAAFVDKADADETLKLVKSYYESKLPNKQVESTFKGSVYIEKRHVSLDKLRSTPQEALQSLTSATTQPIVYVMRPGDRAINIAAKYHVSTDQLKRLNPEKDLNRLIAGDQLTVQPARTALTVISKALVNKTEDVTPPYQGRRYRHLKSGKRQMQVLMTYENGQPTGEEVISRITTWDRPKNQPAEDTETYRGYRHYRHHWRHNRSSSDDEDQ